MTEITNNTDLINIFFIFELILTITRPSVRYNYNTRPSRYISFKISLVWVGTQPDKPAAYTLYTLLYSNVMPLELSNQIKLQIFIKMLTIKLKIITKIVKIKQNSLNFVKNLKNKNSKFIKIKAINELESMSFF